MRLGNEGRMNSRRRATMFGLEHCRKWRQTRIVFSVWLQDVMRLDNEGRMNRPGRAEGNWAWRVGESGVWSKLTQEAASLKAMAEVLE